MRGFNQVSINCLHFRGIFITVHCIGYRSLHSTYKSIIICLLIERKKKKTFFFYILDVPWSYIIISSCAARCIIIFPIARRRHRYTQQFQIDLRQYEGHFVCNKCVRVLYMSVYVEACGMAWCKHFVLINLTPLR